MSTEHSSPHPGWAVGTYKQGSYRIILLDLLILPEFLREILPGVISALCKARGQLDGESAQDQARR